MLSEAQNHLTLQPKLMTGNQLQFKSNPSFGRDCLLWEMASLFDRVLVLSLAHPEKRWKKDSD